MSVFRYIKWFLVSVSIVMFTACGGGGSDSDSTSISGGESLPNNKIGVINDASPIEGLKYITTSNISGKTTQKGEFYYQDGDNIKFYIGNILLGKINATESINTLDFASADIVSQLLQTFDYDGKPFNGITISDTLFNIALDYSVSISEIEVDSFYDNSMIEKLISSNPKGSSSVVTKYDAVKNVVLLQQKEDLKSYATQEVSQSRQTKINGKSDGEMVEEQKRNLAKAVYGGYDFKANKELFEKNVLSRVNYFIFKNLYLPVHMGEMKLFDEERKGILVDNVKNHAVVGAVADIATITSSLSSMKKVSQNNLSTKVLNDQLLKSSVSLGALLGTRVVKSSKHPIANHIKDELLNGAAQLVHGNSGIYTYIIFKTANIGVDVYSSWRTSDLVKRWNSKIIAFAILDDYFSGGIAYDLSDKNIEAYADNKLADSRFLGLSWITEDGYKNYNKALVKEYFWAAVRQVMDIHHSLDTLYDFEGYLSVYDEKEEQEYLLDFITMDAWIPGSNSAILHMANEDGTIASSIDGTLTPEKNYNINICFTLENNAFVEVDNLYIHFRKGHDHESSKVFGPYSLKGKGNQESMTKCESLSIDAFDIPQNWQYTNYVVDVFLTNTNDVRATSSYKNNTYFHWVVHKEVEIDNGLEEYVQESILPIDFDLAESKYGDKIVISVQNLKTNDKYGAITYNWEQIAGIPVDFPDNGKEYGDKTIDFIDFLPPILSTNIKSNVLIFRVRASSEYFNQEVTKDIYINIENDDTYELIFEGETFEDGSTIEKNKVYEKIWTVRNNSNVVLENITLKEIQNDSALSESGILPSFIDKWKAGGTISFKTEIRVPENLTQTVHTRKWEIMVDNKNIPYKNGARKAYLSYELTTEGSTSTSDPEPDPVNTSVPPVPTLSSPSNGSSTTDTTPTLQWNSESGATSYQLALASTDGNVIYNLIDVSSASKTTTALTTGKTYRWSVKACNSNGCSDGSSYYSFSVESASTGDVSIVSGLEASDGVYVDKIRVTWEKDLSANSYKVFRCMNTSVNSCSELADVTTTTYDDLTALAESIYYYRIKSIGANNTSELSNYDSGTLSANAVLPVTNRPSASDGIYNDKIIISWSSISGITDGANYEVYRCEDTTINSCELISRRTNTSYTDESKDGLRIGKNYYYRIRIQGVGNEVGEFSNYDIGYLDSTSLEAAPAVASQGIYGDKVHVSWPTVSGATKYDVYACTPFGTMSDEVRESSNCYSIAPAGYTDTAVYDVYADPGVKYWYFIRAWKDGKYGEFSDMSNAGYAGLNIPLVPSVNVVNMGNYLSIRPTPNGEHGAKYYEVYRCTTTETNSCINIQNVIPYNDVQDNRINRNTDYYYRAKSVSYSGNISEFGNYTVGRMQ